MVNNAVYFKKPERKGRDQEVAKAAKASVEAAEAQAQAKAEALATLLGRTEAVEAEAAQAKAQGATARATKAAAAKAAKAAKVAAALKEPYEPKDRHGKRLSKGLVSGRVDAANARYRAACDALELGVRDRLEAPATPRLALALISPHLAPISAHLAAISPRSRPADSTRTLAFWISDGSRLPIRSISARSRAAGAVRDDARAAALAPRRRALVAPLANARAAREPSPSCPARPSSSFVVTTTTTSSSTSTSTTTAITTPSHHPHRTTTTRSATRSSGGGRCPRCARAATRSARWIWRRCGRTGCGGTRRDLPRARLDAPDRLDLLDLATISPRSAPWPRRRQCPTRCLGAASGC